MKILFLTHKFFPDIGGIEVNSEILATAFQKSGHELRLITWTKGPSKKNFPFIIVRNPSLFELLTNHRWADVVFENNPSLRLAWPSVFFNKPSVIALRTWINRPDGRIGLPDKFKFWWIKRADAVIAVSEAIKNKSWPGAVVIGNPFRNEVFKILPGIQRTGGFVFLGRLVSDKGADIAIKAMNNLLNANGLFKTGDAELSLTIIGDGPDMEALKNMAIKFGIQDKIIFKGVLSGIDLVSCLNQHRYLLVPSVWEEPFGNVALEGMACGCIPIVSDGGGLVDAIGNAGLSFKRGDVDDLVDCIINIVTNPVLESKIRAASQQHLADHYPEIVAKRYLNIIESVV